MYGSAAGGEGGAFGDLFPPGGIHNREEIPKVASDLLFSGLFVFWRGGFQTLDGTEAGGIIDKLADLFARDLLVFLHFPKKFLVVDLDDGLGHFLEFREDAFYFGEGVKMRLRILAQINARNPTSE